MLRSWMVGPNWPHQGEIDIIEGVNDDTTDQMTLHTGTGCSPSPGEGGQLGQATGDSDCGEGGGYTGCGVNSDDGNSYGTGFNVAGGVYAMEWTSSSIKVWYFSRENVPSDIDSLDPSTWGTPAANWGGCAFDTYFKDLGLVRESG